MHKHIFIISALAICLLSCSSPEQDDLLIPEPLKGSISFGGNSGTWQDAPTTRAEETGLKTISKSFKVWGYKTIEGKKHHSPIFLRTFNNRRFHQSPCLLLYTIQLR